MVEEVVTKTEYCFERSKLEVKHQIKINKARTKQSQHSPQIGNEHFFLNEAMCR